MQRQQNQRTILAASTMLMLGSLLVEAISKFRLISRFKEIQIANDVDSGPLQLAIHIRDAEVWLYIAVICAVVGVLFAAFAPLGSRDRIWWMRGAVLLVLIFWPLLAVLYVVTLSYPIVGTVYAACFGTLLVNRFQRRCHNLKATETEKGAAKQPATAGESK